ncbi:MAG: bifunctional 5,10-methylenetetrahydrofolate dehydrogenase/5,10-methenyltetrahydrofolate cyclohydrolase [Candidatus Thorarchaeota archaeon]
MIDKILDGKKLADKLNSELKQQIKNTILKTGIRPKLATILIGKDPASKIYINIKNRTAQEVGIESKIVELKESISRESLLEVIDKINNDPTFHGILLQIPLPDNLKTFTSVFLERILPVKDVDGLNPFNRGRLFDYNEELAPCTPKGIITLLEYYNIEISGKDAVIINRSNLVGKPLIFMLLKRDATPIVCHTKTRDINRYIKSADILIVAVRKPKFITKERIKEGVIIIDVGTNRIEGKLCGDVDFDDVLSKCGAISPSPGGVGPLTVHFLLQNTFIAYKKQLNLSEV